MVSSDLIAASVKTAWQAGSTTALLPTSAIYLDRPQQPQQLAGFPYAAMRIRELVHENMSTVDENSLVTYELKIEVYTVQGQTGGATTGDQVTDQGNLMRAFAAILNHIPANLGWNYVQNFLHCLKQPGGEVVKDEELYEGNDVLRSTQIWHILVTED